jgi:hypothetical protein
VPASPIQIPRANEIGSDVGIAGAGERKSQAATMKTKNGGRDDTMLDSTMSEAGYEGDDIDSIKLLIRQIQSAMPHANRDHDHRRKQGTSKEVMDIIHL